MKSSNNNKKYLSRCQYFGKLENWDYVGNMMVLSVRVYTACEHFGKSIPVKISVPTELEERLSRELMIGNDYFYICTPYRVTLGEKFRHRVDLLLNIFEEIV